MRILYLLQDFAFPPDDGVRWKPYNLIKFMSQRHTCDVLSFGGPVTSGRLTGWKSENPGLTVLGVHKNTAGCDLMRRRVGSMLDGLPISLARWDSHSFRLAVKRAVQAYTYDLVHLDMVNMLQYLSSVAHLPTVSSLNDASSRPSEQIAKLVGNPLQRLWHLSAARRLRHYERDRLGKATFVHVVSEGDRVALQRTAPSARVAVIGITLEESYLKLPMTPANSHGLEVLSITPVSSKWAADPVSVFLDCEVPRILQEEPGVTFRVLGRNPHPSLAKVARTLPNTIVTPWVDDYPSTLQQAAVVLFLDVTGSGIKNRVVQALAAGKPVVGTPVAFEGIPVKHGVSSFVCQTPQQAGPIILALLKNTLLRARMGQAGRELVRQEFAPLLIGGKWEALYREAIASHRVSSISRGTP